ncbi:thiosulfate:glutathione sulfurtransferase isoform X1 [Camelus ferus]|uniref:Thiosulfate:glutathione sulfurtransferase isoform X1 n=2 Tax=Camelus TaxID=9836 RepID=A0A8B8RPC8_CAMFR|nr:thiosulfate:glutathione sulfurtransferase isoform X1 [Camelus ferus]XP_045373099.1 thiosulfate:glutathione sulfurtransferase isoform X1 [Camelus bactrianus]
MALGARGVPRVEVYTEGNAKGRGGGVLPQLLRGWGAARFVRPQDRTFQAQPLNLRLPNCRLSILSSRLLLPVSELESALQMEPAAFKALYSAEKPKLEDENLIFFCQMGKRGLQATHLARGLGYKGYGEGLGTTQGPIENGSRKKVRLKVAY